jgi:hypothetical protein
VNGLEATYGEQLDFRSLDAGSGEGLQAFRAYNLLGHPSYLVLDPSGEVLWRAFGPLSKEVLSEVIYGVLD